MANTAPYIGLRPYTRDDSDLFFGREGDTQILLDKILANRLTLLFAASGVGKSSLLQVGIMLKRAGRVFYCNSWVASSPHEATRNAGFPDYATLHPGCLLAGLPVLSENVHSTTLH